MSQETVQTFMSSLFAKVGTQWPSGRVLDSRIRGRGLEWHLHHCIKVFELDNFILA